MNFEEFQSELRKCRYCKDIERLKFEPKPLVWGNKNAKIVQISQAPSLHASMFGRPFSKSKDEPDASGKRLLAWYDIPKDVFLNPNIFYITAIAHCFPGKNKSGDARPPVICAKLWLWKELSYLDPKLFLVIGRHASNFIFPNKNFTELVFTDQTLLSKPCFVLPHPSPANKKWFKENPEFERKRLKEIRVAIHDVIKC